MTPNTGPAARDPEVDTLAAALPRVINFRFLPPRTINDPVWAEIATELLAALPAPDPAPVEGGLRALIAAVEKACPVCHGDGWVVEAVPLPSGEPGDPYQAPCWDAEHAVILNGLGTALAVRPAPSATIPDEDLPGYRQPFTGPLGSRGDPTVALPAPSGDADAAWEALERLTRRHTDPLDKIERVNHGPAWMHVAGDPACFICAALALRAAAPSDGACPRCGRSGAALSCPDCNAEFRAPSDGAGGLDVERLAEAIDGWQYYPVTGGKTYKRRLTSLDAPRIAAIYAALSDTTP